jgi:hypothetical protein
MATKPANLLAASSAPFIVAALAFIFSVMCVVRAGTVTMLNGSVLLLLGVPVYVWLSNEPAASVQPIAVRVT